MIIQHDKSLVLQHRLHCSLSALYYNTGLHVFLSAVYSSPSTQESSINACHDAGLHSLSNRDDHHCACGCVGGPAGVQAEQGFQHACGESWLVCMLDASCHMCAA